MLPKVKRFNIFRYFRILFLGKWEEADGTSKEAAEKDPNFADTLINQVVVRFLIYLILYADNSGDLGIDW